MARAYGSREEEDYYNPRGRKSSNRGQQASTAQSRNPSAGRKSTASRSVTAPSTNSTTLAPRIASGNLQSSLFSKPSVSQQMMAQKKPKDGNNFWENIVQKTRDFGTAKSIGVGVRTGANVKMPGAVGAAMPTLPLFEKTLDDYLAEAGDGSNLAAGELSALSAREQALNARAGVSDAKIAEIYASLANSMGQAGTDAGARYQGEVAQAANNTAATQANISAANGSAQQAQSAIAANLGFTDVAPSAAANNQAVDNAHALSGTAVSGGAQQNYMQSMGNSQQNYFAGNKAAANFRGAEERVNLQGDLSGRLAEMQQERSGIQSQARERALALAQARYEADYGRVQNERQYRDQREDLGYDRDFQMAQLEAESAANQPEAAELPTFARVRQGLESAMPSRSAAVALQVMAEAKNANNPRALEKAMTRDGYISAGLSPSEAQMALQFAQEYMQGYNY